MIVHFVGMGVKKGKMVVQTLKAIIDPVREELKKSEEDENLEASLDGAGAWSRLGSFNGGGYFAGVG